MAIFLRSKIRGDRFKLRDESGLGKGWGEREGSWYEGFTGTGGGESVVVVGFRSWSLR